MRRWNGWGDDAVETTLPPRALELLDDAGRTGHAAAGRDPRRGGRGGARLAPGARSAPRRRPDRRASATPAARACRTGSRCARGRLGAVPDAVARPAGRRRRRATCSRWPPAPARRSSRTAAGRASSAGSRSGPRTARSSRWTSAAPPACARLDETSRLATFGAGHDRARGRGRARAARADARPLPAVVRVRRPSAAGSSTRSAGQQSRGFGRIEDLFAGGHLETPRGPFDLPTHPGVGGRAGPARARPRLGGAARHRHRRRRPCRRAPDASSGSAATSSPTGIARCSLARRLAQSGLPLSMVRVVDARSRPPRPSRSPATAGRPASCAATSAGAGWGRSAASRIVGLAGDARRRGRRGGRGRTTSSAARAASPARRSARPGGTSGSRRRTCATRCGTPATRSTRSRPRPTGRALPAAGRGPRAGRSVTGWTAIERARPRVQPPVARLPERVEPVRRPTSSAWPPTRTRRSSAGARLKTAASEVIVDHGGDDQPPARRRRSTTRRTSAAEKGALGMAALDAVVRTLRSGRP